MSESALFKARLEAVEQTGEQWLAIPTSDARALYDELAKVALDAACPECSGTGIAPEDHPDGPAACCPTCGGTRSARIAAENLRQKLVFAKASDASL